MDPKIWESAPPFIYFAITVTSLGVLAALITLQMRMFEGAIPEATTHHRKIMRFQINSLGGIIIISQLVDWFKILTNTNCDIVNLLLVMLLFVQIPVYAHGLRAIKALIKP